ncbi:hypothetical protein VV02_17720 [Luteipulveratus mongoliensis]|uniref:LysM domain-containing protein n=2 Tax=Luteipulveratus mongoliensis TaxID=571913 RepID=A0A0K1JR34_9MICO|nr:hypothetical protein VV02_17720 [Luteipulveratus mongoliensis]
MSRARGPRLRLTPRGRLMLLLAGALAVLGLVTASVAAASSPSTPPTRVVTVEPGATLSEIAQAELPGLPVHEGVARLQLANRLSSLQVSAGQRLVIPQG